MKTFLMLCVLIWFVVGVSAANDRGFFQSGYPRTCSTVGSASLTVVAGPINYIGVHPTAYC
jgi:hypothetical protein